MTRNERITTDSGTASCELTAVNCSDVTPTDDQIRSRAHELYQARCATGSGGDELADWVAAECELKARRNGSREPTEYGSDSSAASNAGARATRADVAARPKTRAPGRRTRRPSAKPLSQEVAGNSSTTRSDVESSRSL